MAKTKKKKTIKGKLEELKTVDGQHDASEGVVVKEIKGKQYRSVDELFGFHGATYKTYEPTEYRTSLVGMNLIDLRKECFRVGLIANDNRNIMIERLMKQFGRITSSVNGPQFKPVKFRVDDRVRAILAEGANKII